MRATYLHLILLIGCTTAPMAEPEPRSGFRLSELSTVSGTLDGDTAMDVADIDGDGDDDIAYVAHDSVLRVAKNDGMGHFEDVFAWSLSGSTDITAVAWLNYDSHGALDIVVGHDVHGGEEAQILIDDGADTWVAAASGRQYDSRFYVEAIAVGDCDGDGDDDIAVASNDHGYYSFWSPEMVYRNDGSTLRPTMYSDNMGMPPWDVDFGDYDGDGDLDLAVASDDWGDGAAVYKNDGSCNFGFSEAWASDEDKESVSVEFVDLNGDGLDDVIVGTKYYGLDVYLSNGSTFFSYWSSGAAGEITSTDAADYDADGDIDIAVAYRGPQADVVFINRGDGSFVQGWESDLAVSTDVIGFADLEGDGDLDLLVGAYRWYENDGLSLRVDTVTPSAAGGTNTVEVRGALAGANVRVLVATSDATSTAVPGCPDLAVAHSAPMGVSPETVADADGNASVPVLVPSAASGLTAYLSVIDMDSCAASDVFVTTF